MCGVKSHVGIRVQQPGAWKVFGAESADSFGGDPARLAAPGERMLPVPTNPLPGKSWHPRASPTYPEPTQSKQYRTDDNFVFCQPQLLLTFSLLARSHGHSEETSQTFSKVTCSRDFYHGLLAEAPLRQSPPSRPRGIQSPAAIASVDFCGCIPRSAQCLNRAW